MIALGRGAEFDLIRALVGGTVERLEGVMVGPGDDCAVLEGGVVLTCDMAVEDVHFRRDWLTPREIGYRAAAAGLSDLAAMAARPVAVLVSYALPREDGRALAPELHGGVEEACRLVGAAVVGGDVTASSGPLVVDVVAAGRNDAPVLRSGAQPGHELWVTGRLGGAAAAVALRLEDREPPGPLREAFARPRPRTAEALWLAERVRIGALIDLSDGIAGDAGHLAAASGATLVLEASAIPVAPAAADALGDERALSLALSGGEDYELLLAAPPGTVGAVAAAFADAFGVSLIPVGRVVERQESPVLLEGEDGTASALEAGGYDHFRRAPGAGADR